MWQDIRRNHQIVLQDHMAGCGYEVMETPIIDSADLFLTKAGDQILTRLFTFERHGRQLALRPEFTAQAAFHYVEQYPSTSPIVRWQFNGPIFESDPYDLTRYYQRFSVGAELIGVPGVEAEAEIISMAARGLDAIGINSWQVVMGHVGLMRHLLSVFGLDRRTERFLLNQRASLRADAAGVNRVLQKLDQHLFTQSSQQEVVIPRNGQSMGGRTSQEILRRLQEKRERASKQEQIHAAIAFLQKWTDISGTPQDIFPVIEKSTIDTKAKAKLLEWQQVIKLLQEREIPLSRITLQPDLARNWDYYTGLVFELRVSESLSVVSGGGRYDELTRIIGGKRDVPAVGFAYYFDQIPQQLETL